MMKTTSKHIRIKLLKTKLKEEGKKILKAARGKNQSRIILIHGCKVNKITLQPQLMSL